MGLYLAAELASLVEPQTRRQKSARAFYVCVPRAVSRFDRIWHDLQCQAEWCDDDVFGHIGIFHLRLDSGGVCVFFGIKMSSPFSYVNLENDIAEGIICTQPTNSPEDLKEALECKRMLASLQTFRSNMDPSVDYGSSVATLNWLILSGFAGIVITLVTSVGADRYREQNLKAFALDQMASFCTTFALILGAQMEYSQYAIDAGQEGVDETAKMANDAFCTNQRMFATANPNFATTTDVCWTAST